MFAMSRNTSASADDYQDDATPRAVIRIAFPSFRNGRDKTDQKNAKPQPTSREELLNLFGDELRGPVKSR